MTDKKQPEALRIAALLEKTGAQGSLRDEAASELRRQYAEIETLRTGYEAARLEIESLQSQLNAVKQINAAQFGLLAASIPGSAMRASHGQAPQQPGVGNSGFDHKTAADFLNGKTVSDEAMRKFVAASRWAHDDRAGLQATLLSVRRELASRDAEIALLKTALMNAEEAAPTTQPAPAAVAGPSDVEPLHITHGPLMRHAAYLLRSRKPALPEHESVAKN